MVVFTHLRWEGVFQRPQHLLSRFARALPVTVVEEPIFRRDVTPGGDIQLATDGKVTVLTPILPLAADNRSGFTEENVSQIALLIEPYLGQRSPLETIDPLGTDVSAWESELRGPIVWYYTPMALGALPASVVPSLVVFDAMDDLASFRGAPAALREREAEMFARADVVFAGGPSLYEARRGRHPSVHCFPSGVDVDHFARAAGTIAPDPSVAALPGTVLGFYGVLDERIDFSLIEAIADARAEWSLALVGPLAKIDESDLPRRPNITYFGRRNYADLPAFLAGFDVALLPFAINEATRSISPTKTLEYLAGEKPIVSTPITDVVDLYGDVVRIAGDEAAFIAAIEAAVSESPAERRRRVEAGSAHLRTHTWDAIVDGMADLMSGAMRTAESTTT